MTIKIFTTAIITGILSITFGILLGQVSPSEFAAHMKKWNVPAEAENAVNPYAHNTAATDSGKIIYQKICSVCHGTGGKGDGVAAVGLSVQPANHTSDHVQSQSDGALYYEITTGHAPMPSYKTVLNDKQRWQVVNFIRTLKSKPHK